MQTKIFLQSLQKIDGPTSNIKEIRGENVDWTKIGAVKFINLRENCSRSQFELEVELIEKKMTREKAGAVFESSGGWTSNFTQ